jgi:hypothetical protein
MKLYICRRGLPDFVVDAPNVGAGIIAFWNATRELPRASYRVHHGRRRQGRTISSAVAYWLLASEMQPLLRGVIEENATPSQYQQFCENITTAGQLLEK